MAARRFSQGVLFGTVMLGNITGSTLGSRLVRRVGIRAIVRTHRTMRIVTIGAAPELTSGSPIPVLITESPLPVMVLDGVFRHAHRPSGERQRLRGAGAVRTAGRHENRLPVDDTCPDFVHIDLPPGVV